MHGPSRYVPIRTSFAPLHRTLRYGKRCFVNFPMPRQPFVLQIRLIEIRRSRDELSVFRFIYRLPRLHSREEANLFLVRQPVLVLALCIFHAPPRI